MKPFLDSTMSIFEEYGAFNNSSVFSSESVKSLEFLENTYIEKLVLLVPLFPFIALK